jgi:CRP-like cAMP-binding protein
MRTGVSWDWVSGHPREVMMPTTHLKSHEVFHFLRPEQVDAISSAAEEVTPPSGKPVFLSGEPADYFYIVLDGRVTLYLPGPDGASTVIDELNEGAIFGSCVCFQIGTYMLNALCTEDSRLLKIRAEVLKKLMDDDLVMGYAIQTLISRVYFKRYVETMGKLQSVGREGKG